jgi:hypothetical protein
MAEQSGSALAGAKLRIRRAGAKQRLGVKVYFGQCP